MTLARRFNALLHSTKHTFKQACDRYDLVYFGHVDQRRDEHTMVRGFTLSPSHVDKHYCVGSVDGRDVIFLERTDTVSFPDKPSERYTWTILQVDLRRENLPHIILNANSYSDALYANLFTKFHHLRPAAPDSFTRHDSHFSTNFTVYGEMHAVDTDTSALVEGTTSVLGQHFSMYDYEYFEDHLIVYFPTTSPLFSDIEHMLKAGLWFANELDSSSR